jgi:hypothetical protein
MKYRCVLSVIGRQQPMVASLADISDWAVDCSRLAIAAGARPDSPNLERLMAIEELADALQWLVSTVPTEAVAEVVEYVKHIPAPVPCQCPECKASMMNHENQ